MPKKKQKPQPQQILPADSRDWATQAENAAECAFETFIVTLDPDSTIGQLFTARNAARKAAQTMRRVVESASK